MSSDVPSSPLPSTDPPDRWRTAGPTALRGPLRRGAVTVGLVLATAVGYLALFVALVVVTRGAASGWVACFGALTVATTLVGLRGRLRARRPRTTAWRTGILTGIVVFAVSLTVAVCVPTVPPARRALPPLPSDPASSWSLSTGSRIAVYHDAPPPGVPRRAVPLVFLAGGPVRGLSLRDHAVLRSLADRGWDVWAPEPAGGGRSDDLPLGDYSIERSVADTDEVIARVGHGSPVDVVGFSAGADVLARALTQPDAPARVRRAVIAEPGPVDGPTAALAGPEGRPDAAGLAHLDLGRPSTTLPRYAVGFGLVQLGLLAPRNAMISQAEAENAFTQADLAGDTASAYCAGDADRIPAEDSAANFQFNPLASLQVQDTIKESPSLDGPLRAARVPAMVVLGECSSQRRAWETHLIQTYGAVNRVQYLPGVGHHLWNALDGNTDRADDAVTAFLDDGPGPVPDYPEPRDIPAFLAAGR